MITFFRRNENMLIVKYVENTRLITVQVTPIAKGSARRLADIGLGMQGQFRVKTDARVVGHNAGRVVDAEAQRRRNQKSTSGISSTSRRPRQTLPSRFGSRAHAARRGAISSRRLAAAHRSLVGVVAGTDDAAEIGGRNADQPRPFRVVHGMDGAGPEDDGAPGFHPVGVHDL